MNKFASKIITKRKEDAGFLQFVIYCKSIFYLVLSIHSKMFEAISSLQNKRIKNLVLLQQKSRKRKEQGSFVVEGCREILRALEKGFELKEIYFCPEIDQTQQVHQIIQKTNIRSVFEISVPVFEKIAYREGSDGLVAILKSVYHSPENLSLPENPLIVILESVEKPGNLGAILRTADAAAVDAVFVCDPLCDIYNPNVIRSSVGCIFSVPVVVCTSEETLRFLRQRKIKSYAAELGATQWYHQKDYRSATAFVMGTEATGLSRFWLENTDENIKIPMMGLADSLNVSTSTAVLVFEAMRQRNFE